MAHYLGVACGPLLRGSMWPILRGSMWPMHCTYHTLYYTIHHTLYYTILYHTLYTILHYTIPYTIHYTTLYTILYTIHAPSFITAIRSLLKPTSYIVLVFPFMFLDVRVPRHDFICILLVSQFACVRIPPSALRF